MEAHGFPVSVICLAVFGLAGCVNDSGIRLDHEYQGRTYLLHVPEDRETHPPPLVLVMHGYGGSAEWMRTRLGWVQLAEEKGFAVCFPNGTEDQDGRRFWNVGYEMHNESQIDDVDFLVDLTHHLQIEHGLDPEATYATGFSNGADMSYLLGCEASETFRAIGPVAGTMMDTLYFTADPEVPRSVIAVNGVVDSITRYDGDPDNVDGWGAYRSVPEVISLWVRINGLPNCERSSLVFAGGHGESTKTDIERYWSYEHPREVKLFKLKDGTHRWPLESDGGGFDATTTIWDFFDQMD